MSSPSSNNEGNDAWLMKIDLRREGPEEIHKEKRIKTEVEDPAPAAGEEDTSKSLPNLFTSTELEAFRMLELTQIRNKHLTSENLLLKDYIAALKGIIRKLEDLLRSIYEDPPSLLATPSSPPPKKET